MKQTVQWLTVETDVEVPKKFQSNNPRPSTGGHTDTSGSASEEFEESGSSFEEDNSLEITATRAYGYKPTQEQACEQLDFQAENIKICIDDVYNNHLIGTMSNNNGFKITVNHPDAQHLRFLQLATRFNINQDKRYNMDLSAYRKDSNVNREYSGESEIAKAKRLKSSNNPDYLKALNWKIDTLSPLDDTEKGYIIESPYYDQPGNNSGIHSGRFILSDDGEEKSMFDDPELLDLKTAADGINKENIKLCKDTIKFLTFVVDERSGESLACVEWSRVGRPYIAARDDNGVWQKTRWRNINHNEFQFFKSTNKHTYICEYKIKFLGVYSAPQPLPSWVNKVLKTDVHNRKFSLEQTTQNYSAQIEVLCNHENVRKNSSLS